MKCDGNNPIVGKHGWSGSCAPGASHYRFDTFSVGVFEWLPSRKGCKRGKVKVRVKGSTADPERVYEMARRVVVQLDAGEHISAKTLSVLR